MTLTTEIFVMTIFIFGGPFFYFILRDADLKGRKFFILAYLCLLLSNIFTVVEEVWLNTLFNICEHVFISLGSLMMLIAIIQFTTNKNRITSHKP